VHPPASISAEPLDDGRIRIRAFVEADAPRVHAAVAASLPGITQWMPSLHATLGEADIRNWIMAGPRAWTDATAYHFAIVRAAGHEPDAFLGGVNLFQFNWTHRFVNVSYWVRADATGNGVATAATRLAARFAFERLALNRVEILMAPGNPASRRVAEKAGARYEGMLRRRIVCHGTVHDAHLFSLVPSDLSTADVPS
jgi:RimJ/RimL family protein N-acetyltransferase